MREINLLRSVCCAATAVAAPHAALAAGPGGYYAGDLGQAIAVIVTFIILLAILRKWAWRPIVTQLHHRERGIAETLKKAEQQQRQATDLLAHYKSRLDRAEADAQELLANTRLEADRLREDTIQGAQAQARISSEKARREVELAKLQAIKELRETIAEMASDIAQKVIPRELSSDDRKRMLATSLEEITKQSAPE